MRKKIGATIWFSTLAGPAVGKLSPTALGAMEDKEMTMSLNKAWWVTALAMVTGCGAMPTPTASEAGTSRLATAAVQAPAPDTSEATDKPYTIQQYSRFRFCRRRCASIFGGYGGYSSRRFNRCVRRCIRGGYGGGGYGGGGYGGGGYGGGGRGDDGGGRDDGRGDNDERGGDDE